MRASAANTIVKDTSATKPYPESLVPGVMLPEQFFESAGQAFVDAPERRLMFAVLLDAVIQLRRGHTTGAREAAQWIRDRDGDAEAPFSFCNVCEALGLDPTYLARGLLAADSLQRLLGMPQRQLRISRRGVRLPRRRRRSAAG